MKEGDDTAMDEEVTLNQENEQQPAKEEQETQEKQNEQEQQQQQQDEEKPQPNEEPTLDDMIKNEKKSIRERIQKAKAIVKPVEGKNFNTRQDINFEDEELILRPEVLHVYGVDFLSTQDIMNYFDRFEPTKIEWLNDSSCNVVFKNEEVVENAVKALALTIQDAELSEEWKKGLPYKEKNIEFSLYFRLATSKDVKGQTISGKESQYYKYMRQKMRVQRESRQERSNYADRYTKGKSYNSNNRQVRDTRGGNRYNDSQNRNRNNNNNNNRNDKSDNRNNNKNNNTKSNKRRYDDSDDEGEVNKDNGQKEIIPDKENDQEKDATKSPAENRSDEKNEKERERERSRSQKRKQSTDSDSDDDLR